MRGVSAFAGYITVEVCNRHSDLRDKLCVIKTTKKPNIIMLACQMELLRHADVRTTMNVYTQAVSEQKRAAHSSVVRMVLA